MRRQAIRPPMPPMNIRIEVVPIAVFLFSNPFAKDLLIKNWDIKNSGFLEPVTGFP